MRRYWRKGGRGPVRVLKFRLPGAETETLISSLKDSRYRIKRFKELYFKRWPIETKYDEVKKKLEVENFSGILADNIRQDFYAAVTLGNIAGEGNKWKYHVNVNHEIGVLKDRLILMLLEDDGKKR
jgi:hypothetical protein